MKPCGAKLTMLSTTTGKPLAMPVWLIPAMKVRRAAPVWKETVVRSHRLTTSSRANARRDERKTFTMCAGLCNSGSNTSSDSSHEHARCRVRTYISPTQPQGLAPADSQIDSQEIRHGFEICEVVRSWAELPQALQAAILAIVRTHTRDLSIAACRQALTGRPSPEGKQLGRAAPSGRETGCGQVGRGDAK